MIVCNTNTPYYLRELEKNPVNNNRYVYFDNGKLSAIQD